MKYIADLTKPKDNEGNCIDPDYFPGPMGWREWLIVLAIVIIIISQLACAVVPVKQSMSPEIKVAAPKLETATLETMTVCRTDSDVGGLNVRRGPGLEYLVDGYLRNGDEVTVLDTVGKWRKVQAGKLTGWAHGYYICEAK